MRISEKETSLHFNFIKIKFRKKVIIFAHYRHIGYNLVYMYFKYYHYLFKNSIHHEIKTD